MNTMLLIILSSIRKIIFVHMISLNERGKGFYSQNSTSNLVDATSMDSNKNVTTSKVYVISNKLLNS